ncbi:hypothetical protein GMD78_07460 [Ornithinibacillus sp. L9]|uniref:Uncharacterized protein n=1 Tax=Ornithinibacillus caprae TaxID=2678566 RepID=A0A6N8FJS3_9BACI|nr:hypothetical protein [Ornithinibacillus caprae]MUK88227.1 hypothetical protein [Ornithinibacillus caprae]
MSCRNLYKSLSEDDYYNNPAFQEDPYSIRMTRDDCGHYTFIDDQHRSCIAKHLGITSMYVEMQVDEDRDYVSTCGACLEKLEQKKTLGLKDFLFNLTNRKKEEKLPHEFIDEEQNLHK